MLSCRERSCLFIPLLLFILLASACKQETTKEYSPTYDSSPNVLNKPFYIFAIHPLHNPERMFEYYQPIINYINSQTHEFSLKLEASKDYGAFEEKLFKRKFHFALPNPYQSVEATKHGYKIFGKMGDDFSFAGLILVTKSSGIKDISELRGESISFPSATALAAAMMPKYYMKTHGLDVETECDCRYVGSQESSIMNAYLGITTAACTWPPPWEMLIQQHPEVGKSLTVLVKTEPLINNGLIVRNDIPQKHVDVVSNALFNLQNDPTGQEMLKQIHLSQFEKTSELTYAKKVNTLLQQYKKLLGSLPGEKKE